VGWTTLEGFARLLGVSPQEFQDRAAAWWAAQPRPIVAAAGPAAPVVRLRDERYPNRAAAIDLVHDELHPVAIQRIASLELSSHGDPPRWWWVNRLKAEHDQIVLDQAEPLRAAASRRDSDRAADAMDDAIQSGMAAARARREAHQKSTPRVDPPPTRRRRS
jgi:hypothetical protein